MKIASNLFAAGQETTARLLGTALQTLGERPELQQRLRDDRNLVAPFIEEVLRLEPPINGTFRLARTPTTVKGTEIPAASTVMVLPAAANRDPREFERPRRAAARPGERPSTHRLRPRHPHLRRGARWPGPRPTSPSSASSTGWRTSASPSRTTARPATGTGSTPPPGCSAATTGSTSNSRPWVN